MAPLTRTLLIFTTITIFTALTTCHSNPDRRRPFPSPNNEHNNNDIHNKRDVLCPVPCNKQWCCESSQKCISKDDPAEPYQCDDPLLRTTWEAFPNGYLSSVLVAASSIVSDIKSFASEHNLTIPGTATTTSSTTGNAGGAAATGSGPVTLGPGPTRTSSSTVSTTTSSSGAAARLSWRDGGNVALGSVMVTIFGVFWGLS